MKLRGVGKLTPVFKPKRYTTFVAILVIIAGTSSALFASITSTLQQRDALIDRGQTIGSTLSVDDIKSLKGNLEDADNPAYLNLREQLEQIRTTSADIERLHLFVSEPNTIKVAVDGKISDRINEIQPGTKYFSTSPALPRAFGNMQPTHDFMTSDLYGRWVAAYTPVVDPATNKVIAVVGVFIDAQAFYTEIILYALVLLLLASIPLAGIIRDIKIQSKEHEILQLKNQFVSIASHELRSPLTGMLWGIQSLQSGKKLSQSQKDLLDDMYKSAESSLATINEILDMSIFERGQQHKLHKDAFDLLAVVRQVTATMNLAAQEKKIDVQMSKDWPKTAEIQGDVGAIKRALMNVLANAIKYSPDGSKVVIAYRKSSSGEHVLTIKDHGIGIPIEEQPKVLEGYYRASNTSHMQVHGTGLGLWITKKIIEEHGGRLWINSKPDEGTAVSIALPTQRMQ